MLHRDKLYYYNEIRMKYIFELRIKRVHSTVPERRSLHFAIFFSILLSKICRIAAS